MDSDYSANLRNKNGEVRVWNKNFERAASKNSNISRILQEKSIYDPPLVWNTIYKKLFKIYISKLIYREENHGFPSLGTAQPREPIRPFTGEPKPFELIMLSKFNYNVAMLATLRTSKIVSLLIR